jgi:Raf kinase inhibitor-like YbhB/YbcL family protein
VKPMRRIRFWLLASFGLVICLLAPGRPGTASAQSGRDSDGHFRLRSSEFNNNTTLPVITIFNNQSNGANTCSIDGSPGGDQSPELSWTGAPRHTRTFVLVDYDVTAAFTHWGMYNIPGSLSELPANAGVAGSPYGMQIFNDYFLGAQYDGPCPPKNVAPFVHHYVFTLYALNIELKLTGSTNFPAAAETLYHALIQAGRDGHILGSASLTGLYSSTPTSN